MTRSKPTPPDGSRGLKGYQYGNFMPSIDNSSEQPSN